MKLQLISSGVVQVVKIEEAKVQEKADAAKAIKDECEAELSVAMPILQVRRIHNPLCAPKHACCKYVLAPNPSTRARMGKTVRNARSHFHVSPGQLSLYKQQGQTQDISVLDMLCMMQ